jgi:hypothetical protein
MALELFLPKKSIALIVALLVVAGISIVLGTSLPHATITVHAKVSERKVTKDIILSSKSTTPDYIHYSLPAHIITQEGHAQKTYTAGGGDVSQGNSTGTVTFTNNQETEQRLLPHTHLKYADGTMFLTDGPVTGSLTCTKTCNSRGFNPARSSSWSRHAFNPKSGKTTRFASPYTGFATRVIEKY